MVVERKQWIEIAKSNIIISVEKYIACTKIYENCLLVYATKYKSLKLTNVGSKVGESVGSNVGVKVGESVGDNVGLRVGLYQRRETKEKKKSNKC